MQANVLTRPDTSTDTATKAKDKAKIVRAQPKETLKVPFNQLVAWGQNPRKGATAEQQAEMAESLNENGQLQPIGVRQTAKNTYEVFFGLTRFAGFKILVDSGRIPADHPISISVFDVDDTEAVLLAVAENIVRNEMSEIDVAEAVAELAGKRFTNTDIMAKLGLSRKRFSDHLQVARLDDRVKELLRSKVRPYNWGLAISQADAPLRNRIVDEVIARPGEWTHVDQIRAAIREKKINAAHAIFDLGRAKISVVQDLFQEGAGWIDDVEAFWTHQNAAIDALVSSLESEGHAEVTVLRGTPYESWRYRVDENASNRVAFVSVAMDGKVDVSKDLVSATAKAEGDFDFNDELFNDVSEQSEATPTVSPTTVPPRAKAQTFIVNAIGDAVIEALTDRVTGLRCLLLSMLLRDGITTDEKLTTPRQQLLVHNLKQQLGLSDEPTFEQMPEDETVLVGALATLAAATLPAVANAKQPFKERGTIASRAALADGTAFRRHFTPDEAFLEQLNLTELRALAAELLRDEVVPETMSTKQLVTALADAFQTAANGTSTYQPGTVAALNAWTPSYVA